MIPINLLAWPKLLAYSNSPINNTHLINKKGPEFLSFDVSLGIISIGHSNIRSEVKASNLLNISL